MIKSCQISLWSSGVYIYKCIFSCEGFKMLTVCFFYFSVCLLKEGPKVKLSRGESCVMLAGSGPPLMAPSSPGPLSSVTRQPPAFQTATPKTPSPRGSSTSQLQLHSRAGTKTRVSRRTSPRRCQKTVALKVHVIVTVCLGTQDEEKIYSSFKAKRQRRCRSDHVSCFTVWLIQVETIQTVARATDPLGNLSRSCSACCCLFLERPFWLWSTVWPCWCTSQSACVALGAAASWSTWILASPYWLWFYCLPHAFHRSGLPRRWLVFTFVPALLDLLWLDPTMLSRCPGTECCCCRPHPHTFPFQTFSRGLSASLVCRLCTTCTSGS